MQEMWVRSLGWEDPLVKEMTTHSCILAWEIPWTEEPGRLQSMGSQRVGYNLATKQEKTATWILIAHLQGRYHNLWQRILVTSNLFQVCTLERTKPWISPMSDHQTLNSTGLHTGFQINFNEKIFKSCFSQDSNSMKVKWKLLSCVWLFATPWSI